MITYDKMPAGTRLICEEGHTVMTLLRDVERTTIIQASAFQPSEHYQGLVETGQTINHHCSCGKRWMSNHKNVLTETGYWWPADYKPNPA